MNTYDLSVRFYEKNMNYLPMIENMALTSTMEIQHDRKLVFETDISDTHLVISLVDVTGFQQIVQQLTKTFDSFLSVRAETAGVGAIEVATV
jgi:predicted hotdog family 3-hydroxylacyl-ACP dehydratase